MNTTIHDKGLQVPDPARVRVCVCLGVTKEGFPEEVRDIATGS